MEYDENLLHAAPSATREQKQQGYDSDLATHSIDPQHVGNALRTSPDKEVDYAASHHASSVAVDNAKPWYKTRKWLIIFLIAGIIVVVAVVVGGAVGGTVGHHKSSDAAASAAGGAVGGESAASSDHGSSVASSATGGGAVVGQSGPAQTATTATTAAAGGGGGGGGGGPVDLVARTSSLPLAPTPSHSVGAYALPGVGTL